LFDPGGAILPPRPQYDCAIVSSGGQGWPRFSRPPEGLVLDGREHDGTLAVSKRKTTMRGSGARLVITAIVADSRFPFPQSLQKSGNSNREVHRLSRFRNHQTACSCLQAGDVCRQRMSYGRTARRLIHTLENVGFRFLSLQGKLMRRAYDRATKNATYTRPICCGDYRARRRARVIH
jgi:hypothetical protein